MEKALIIVGKVVVGVVVAGGLAYGAKKLNDKRKQKLLAANVDTTTPTSDSK